VDESVPKRPVIGATVSTRDEGWQQRVRELLERYAAAVQKMSDESLIAVCRRYKRLQVHDLREIATAELKRRGLSVD